MGLFGLFRRGTKSKDVGEIVVNSDEACYHEAMKALNQNDFKGAYRIICQWKVDSGKPGLGFDWKDELENGLREEKEALLCRLRKRKADPKIMNSAIFSILSGAHPSAVAKWAYVDKEDREKASPYIYYFTSYYSSLYDVWQAEEDGCDGVSILATLDKETCSACGKMDGRIIKMSECRVGENVPPFHIGCRCTTVPYYEGSEEDLSD